MTFYPNGFSSSSPEPPLLPPPEVSFPKISTIVSPAFWVLSTARAAARVGTGVKPISAKMFFKSSPGTN